MKLFGTLSLLVLRVTSLVIGSQHFLVKKDSDGLQDIITYDEHSLLIYGQRIFIFSGEFHAYRLPVPDLWLDIFQKVKALGFQAVSFYTDWALLEGSPGNYTAEGVFALEPFFEAAQSAGMYLIARPGPYINAESSGGGFPGWVARIKGKLRTRAPDYLSATDNYMSNVGKTLAKYQITNGGPIILVQPENEYTSVYDVPEFPDPVYMAYVENQLREAGITVPLILNDASMQGYFAPGWSNGTTAADVNIYGYDSYPLGFDCANPEVWPSGDLPLNFASTHELQSPSTFNSIDEFQSGSFDPWGGSSFEQCAILLNHEFERVFFKNNYAARLSLLNLYMIFGGTNWGNLGYSVGYTSYDYGAPINENREVTREKYSELKLQGNFLKVSPSYLTASVGTSSSTSFTNSPDIFVTPLYGEAASNFYISRHSDYQARNSTSYSFKISTSKGNLTVPQLGGQLTLSGRDSKWLVTDYDLGGSTLLYSTAEVFTWKKYVNKTVLVVYGGPNELHELALVSNTTGVLLEGSNLTIVQKNETSILNWNVSAVRRVVQLDSVFVYIVDRNTAYNYWTVDLPRDDMWGNYSTNLGNTTSLIIEAGYLVRNVHFVDSSLYVEGDLNATTTLRILGTPELPRKLYFNGEELTTTSNNVTGELVSRLKYIKPVIALPDFSASTWKYLNNLPEISLSYDDAQWQILDQNTSNNPLALLTPSSMYASDYGFHTGALIYRGHFIATGNETTLSIWTQGGTGFGSTVFLNNTYIGSWAGANSAEGHNSTYSLPSLISGKSYVFTVIVDNNGLDENWTVGLELMKTPRGIINYSLSSRSQSSITWKLTGNLGGEDYFDKIRGPLNEGGLFAERQGYHQPNPPMSNWTILSPFKGAGGSGFALFTTSFDLDLPYSYDIPLTFHFANTTINNITAKYQVQLYVNGWQFGKYINNIGPQTSFPVPQGILNYHGSNWLALEIWSRQTGEVFLQNFTLEAGSSVMTSMKEPRLVESPSYAKRPGAY